MLNPHKYPLTAPAGTPLYDAQLSLRRLSGTLESVWSNEPHEASERASFEDRLGKLWPDLFSILRLLYGHRYDFFYHLEQCLKVLAESWLHRSQSLKGLDFQREHDPTWYHSQTMIGGALYVDLFSENLSKLKDCVPYFQKLGLTYLHLMPLFAVRPGDNDGGYAISNYRSIDPRIGTLEELQALVDVLHEAKIVLVLDFVLNHTADDHYWARQALAGDPEFREYYYIFPDRKQPDQYEQTLREIFPTVRRGNFTWHDGLPGWVWTTFNSYQWDLNYSNPSVFRAMLSEMLFLANTGVDCLRFDAVAFIWKRLGTSCENLPEAHLLVQAFNAAARLAAPSLLFKSEAIVHPDEVIQYIKPNECQISYNPTLMALCWESLATREIKLLHQSLSHRHQLPAGTTWVNYLRCHDDIGWTFDDGDAAAVGIHAYDHRQFLNQFYTGQFPGSFARGIPFQFNPQTGDMRISGTMASLAGLEKALEEQDADEIDLAVRRILLLNSMTLSIGGIPLLYLGEEWGMLNDYDFVKDPAKAGDSRWIHRAKMKWEWLENHGNSDSVQHRIFQSLTDLIQVRKQQEAFAGNQMSIFSTGKPSVIGYVRRSGGHQVLVVANFSEHAQEIPGNPVRIAGIHRVYRDLMTQEVLGTSETISLGPYQFRWLGRE
jgi:amylosucrase